MLIIFLQLILSLYRGTGTRDLRILCILKNPIFRDYSVELAIVHHDLEGRTIDILELVICELWAWVLHACFGSRALLSILSEFVVFKESHWNCPLAFLWNQVLQIAEGRSFAVSYLQLTQAVSENETVHDSKLTALVLLLQLLTALDLFGRIQKARELAFSSWLGALLVIVLALLGNITLDN